MGEILFFPGNRLAGLTKNRDKPLRSHTKITKTKKQWA